jgi:hypothetical protein
MEGGVSAEGKDVIPLGNTACHLQIYHAIMHTIAPDDLNDHALKRLAVHWPVNPQFGERAAETIEMACHVHNLAARDLTDLIDAIGKLITAVFNMNAGIRMGNILAIDIGNARHRQNPYSN